MMLTRPALVGLLVALSFVMLPHILYLPWWLTLAFFMALTWRWQIARRRLGFPGRWLLWLLTIVMALSLLVHYETLLGRNAGVALLAGMAALKLLETRQVRDAVVLTSLGYFLVLGFFFYDQSMLSAAYLVTAVTILILSQLLYQQPTIPLPACIRLAVTIVLQAIPVMLILFVLFPRISGPLWGLPSDAFTGYSGLSDSMTPGSISNLIKSDTVAFRVRFHDTRPAAADLYWRGPVLWWFRDRTWSARDEALSPELPYRPLGKALKYTITLEPHGKRWLFALDRPGFVPAWAGMTSTLQLKHKYPINSRQQYHLQSHIGYAEDVLPDYIRRLSLQLPFEGNERSRALAQLWRSQGISDDAIVEQALSRFRRQDYFYTLNPPLLGTDSVDEFLFDTRRGFCEHYAGSFVFLMRAAQIPARVVTGYQGGENNGDYLIVRQSDAHAWAEVWLPAQGWVRVDPTAAVAPQRVEQGLHAALADGSELPLLARRDSSWLRSLALSWDKINNGWNDWVLAYNDQRQKRFLSNLGLGVIDWYEMAVALLILLLGVALVATAFYWYRGWRQQDSVSRLHRRFCDKLSRLGTRRLPNEGAIALADRAGKQWPELAPDFRQIATIYNQLRFGESGSALKLQQLRRLIDGLPGQRLKPGKKL